MNNTLIIGELIFDNHFLLKKIGKSLETNTPKFKIDNFSSNFGGAGFVYKELRKLNKKKLIFLKKNNDKKYLINDKNIITIKSNEKNINKNRYWLKDKKIFQLNDDNCKKSNEQKFFLNKLKSLLKDKKKINKIVISDYNNGLIFDKLIKVIIKYCKNKKVKLLVDTQVRKLDEIKNFNKIDFFFMNTKEKKLYLRKYKCKTIKELMIKKKIKNLIIKKGWQGAEIFGETNFKISGISGKKIIDEAGAGDTFIANFTYYIDRYNIKDCLIKSNKAAYKTITREKKYVR